MSMTDLSGTDGVGRDRFVYVTAALAALNGLLFGFDTGIISGAFLYIKQTFVMTPLVRGIVVSGAMAGAAAGAALGGRLADRLGRRRLILLGAAVFFVGSFTMAVAPNVPVLVAGRLIDGVAIGFASIVGPLYISEIYPLSVRGSAMGAVTVANWGANLLVSLTFPVLTADVGESGTFWLFGAFSAAALAFTYYLVPETKGRSLEAIEADLRENVGDSLAGDADGAASDVADD